MATRKTQIIGRKVNIIRDADDDAHRRFQEFSDNNSSYISIAKECLFPGIRITSYIYSLDGNALINICSGSSAVPSLMTEELMRSSGPLFIESSESGSRDSLLSPGPIRTVLVGFPTHGSSLS